MKSSKISVLPWIGSDGEDPFSQVTNLYIGNKILRNRCLLCTWWLCGWNDGWYRVKITCEKCGGKYNLTLIRAALSERPSICRRFTLIQHPTTRKGAGIAQWYRAALRAGWSGVRVLAEAGDFSPHHRVQNGSGAYPVSYPIGTRVYFSEDKAAGVWSWPLTSIQCQDQECVDVYLHSLNTYSRSDA
jgi:hypothetical protein